MDLGKTRRELTAAIECTLEVDDMTNGVHVRVMLTRGIKKTLSRDPRVTVSGPNLGIIIDHKVAVPTAVSLASDYSPASSGVVPRQLDRSFLRDTRNVILS